MPVSPLCEWVAFYKPPAAPPTSVSLRTCVANVVRMAFPTELDESAHDWHAILHVLNNHAAELNLAYPLRSELLHEFYNIMLGSLPDHNPPRDAELELERTLSALCVGAFKGAHQASFVNDVLSLSEHIQLTLFTLLREDEDSEAISGDGVPSNSPTKPDLDRHAPSTPVQPTRQASSGSATPASSCSKNEMKRMARENRILKEENAALQADLVQAKDAMAALHDADEKRKDDFENLKLELRVDAAKNERAIKKQVDEYVAHLQDELAKATSKLQSLSGIEAELAAARDELDILKPAADKAAKLEARVEKYQAKLDEMTRVKESNKRLEEKTAELSEKTLAQEAQLQKLLTVQRKLDETKESMANLAVRCSELDMLVGRRDLEKNALAAELESVRQELAMQVRLKHDMQTSMDQLHDAVARGGSLSAPAIEHLVDGDLQDEVEALRRQVAKLEGQLSLESATRVDALGEDLDIMARVKKSFETKYFDSQRVVEQLEAELAASKEQLDAVKALHDAATVNLAASIAACGAIQAEFSSAKDAWAARDDEWRSSDAAFQEKLAIEHQRNADQTRAIESLMTERDDLIQVLAEQQAATASVESARDELKVEVLNLTVNLADTISKLEDHEQRYAKLLTDMDTTKELWMAESNEFAAFKVAAEVDRCKLDEMSAKHDELERGIARLRNELDVNESQRAILEHLRFDNDSNLALLRSSVCDLEARLVQATESWHVAEEDGAVWRQMKADDRDQWAADRAALAKEARFLEACHADARAAWAAELQEAKNETDVQRRVAQDTHDALDAKVQAMEEEAAQAKAAHDRRVCELEQARQELADKVAVFCVREKRGEEVLRELKTKYVADTQALEDQIQLLEVQTSRLEGKNRMLEKERAHLSHHESAKRHMSAGHDAVSLKMEMQLNALKAELESLGKEHKALQSKVHLCTCNLTCDPSMKGYVDSIKLMELQQQADSERRRELILLNAKLVQEQKQLVLCTTSQAQEIQKLKDVTNRLRLREERRTKAMEKENNTGTIESPRQALLSPTLKRKLANTPTTQTTPSGAKRSRTAASPQAAATQLQSPATDPPSSTLLHPSPVVEEAPAQCSQQ